MDQTGLPELNTKDIDSSWAFILLVLLMMQDDLKDLSFLQTPDITEKERARDEEYSQLGACERVIEDNRYSLRSDHLPFLKKDGDILRCHGYIYSMNEEVCNECLNCRIQYGHPFDPYWNIKDEDAKQYVSEEVLKTNQNMAEMLNGMFKDVQDKRSL